jgi:acyl dehydratase
MNSLTAGDLTTDMAGLPQLVGAKLGPSEWVEMTQEQVNQFADLTGDHNFLHVDPERAKATPFAGTIAHGFLSLSLVVPVGQRLHVSDAATTVNYGVDKVRFPAPLPVGARWRASAELTEVTDINGGLQAKIASRIEVEGSDRPAVAADCVIRFYA